MIQEHNSDKVVALTVKAARMTEDVLKKAIRQFLAQQKSKSPKVYKGKQSVKHLVRGSGNNQLTNIEITDQNIKAFNKTAHKYGVDYALKKDSSAEPPKYLVFFKAKDNDVMTAAFKHFLDGELKKNEKPSIKKRLRSLREQVAAKQQERTREKTKSREAEL